MQHGNHGDADINFTSADSQSNTTILRQTFFGNIHPCHDFQATDDGGAESLDFSRHWLYLQHPVHSEANLQIAFLWFNMNIAGLLFNGFHHQFVDQLNNGGGL